MALKPSIADPPHDRPGSFPRPALVRRFRLAGRRRIVVVHGAAQCGKTSAIGEYVAHHDGPVAVLRLRPEHAGIAHVARALATALEPLVPAIPRLLSAAFMSARRQPQPWDLVALWFADQLRTPMTIVVDEIHRLGDDEPTLAFLARLIDATSADVRWILGVRSTAVLPLPRWLAAGDADASLDGLALRLHEDEIPALATFLGTGAGIVASLRVVYDGVVGPIVAHGSQPNGALRADDDDGVTPDRAAAARALEQDGRIAEALHLFVAARATADIARILDERGFDLFASGSADIVCTAVEALPDDERRARAIALTLEAIDESSRGRYDIAESWFEHALRLARDEQQRMHVDVAFAVELLRRGRPDALDRLEALAQIVTAETHAVTVLASLATAHAQAGLLETAERYRTQALDALPFVHDEAVHATVHQRAAFVALTCGNIAEAEKHAKLAATRANEQGNYELLAVAESVTCVVAYSYNDDHEQTLSALGRIAQAGSLLKNAFFRRFALIHSCLIAAERGDAADLSRLDRELAHEELESSVQHVDEGLLPARALAHCWSGDFEAAYDLLRSTGGRQPAPEMLALRWSEIALYAAAAGHDDEARAAMLSALHELRATPNGPSVDHLRAALLTAMSAVLVNADDVAVDLLLDAVAWIDRWPRWRPFHAIVTAMHHDPAGAAETMMHDLARMHDAGLGGWAAMIEQLPLHRVVAPAG